jgi:hypothetical protein
MTATLQPSLSQSWRREQSQYGMATDFITLKMVFAPAGIIGDESTFVF